MSLDATSPCHCPSHEIIHPESNIHDQAKPKATRRRKWQTHGMTISLVERQDKANRLYEKRGIEQQDTAFDEGFTHKGKIKIRKVANASMNELGRFAPCATAKVYFLNNPALETPTYLIQRNPN